MVGRCRSAVARFTALLLLLQALAAAMATAQAAAARIDPLAGIPICGTPAARAPGPGVPAQQDRHRHGLDACCLAGCCPGSLAAVLPPLRGIAAPGTLPDAATPPVRQIGSSADRAADRFRARAPPLSL